MLAKENRLSERQVKKVLRKGKPFFSYTLVIHTLPSTLDAARCAIVISGKSVPSAVVRNMYRRKFYSLCREYLDHISGDIVLVVKSKSRLSRQQESFEDFEKNIHFLFKKILGKNT